jgi:hypothetical protein
VRDPLKGVDGIRIKSFDYGTEIEVNGKASTHTIASESNEVIPKRKSKEIYIITPTKTRGSYGKNQSIME